MSFYRASSVFLSLCWYEIVQALMSIKGSLKDPHGALKNWDKDAVDPCSWTMVTCSSENLVISL
jgi:Leucine rich repeat N-terminal domain